MCVRMYMYVSMYVCMYVRMYVYILYMCVYVCIYACMYFNVVSNDMYLHIRILMQPIKVLITQKLPYGMHV